MRTTRSTSFLYCAVLLLLLSLSKVNERSLDDSADPSQLSMPYMAWWSCTRSIIRISNGQITSLQKEMAHTLH